MSIGFGIIGCGHIGARHAKHIVAHEGAKLVGLTDIDPSKSADLAKRFEGSTTDLQGVLDNPDINVVNICTPNGLHGEYCIRALESGKHVLVEKPMEINSDLAQQMVNRANDLGLLLFVTKQNRYNPPVSRLKEVLNSGLLGQVYHVDIRCIWNRNKAYYDQSSWRGTKDLDGGCLFTQFSHFIDILYFLFGVPSDVSGVIGNFNHPYIETEDNGVFSFKLKNGGLGSLSYSTSSYEGNMEGSLTVVAEKGTIKVGGKYLNTIEYNKGLESEFQDLPMAAPANDYGFYEGSMSNHHEVIDNVVQTIQGKQEVKTTGAEGLDVVRIIESFYANAKQL